jgi:hypothetical protein
MSDQSHGKTILIISVDGSAAIETGESIKVRFREFGDGKVELIVPIAQAIELMGLLGTGLDEAARKRGQEEPPDLKH